jgi:hypothetical protein
MKKTLHILTLISLAPLVMQARNTAADISGADQQATIMMYLQTQCRAQLHIAQQAAQAFSLNPADVEVCLALSEGPCRKKHATHNIVIHLSQEQIATHPELSRYDIYVSMYIQALLRNNTIIKGKQRTNFLKGVTRTATIGLTSFGLFHYLQKYAAAGNNPSLLLSGLGATTCASLWGALFDRANLSYKLPLEQLTNEELTQIIPRDEAALETVVCNKLLKQGHKDTVLLQLGHLQADRRRLQAIIEASFPIAQKGQPVSLTKEQSLQLHLFHAMKLRIEAIEKLLQGHGIRQLNEEIAHAENNSYEIMLKPMLEQLLETSGQLPIAREYRNFVHFKAQHGDPFTPYGIRCSTAMSKIKEFCAQHGINLPSLLKEIALAESAEISSLVQKAGNMENGQRLLKKLLAHFLRSCELALDDEIDNNEHLKKMVKVLESALANYPKN